MGAADEASPLFIPVIWPVFLGLLFMTRSICTPQQQHIVLIFHLPVAMCLSAHLIFQGLGSVRQNVSPIFFLSFPFSQCHVSLLHIFVRQLLPRILQSRVPSPIESFDGFVCALSPRAHAFTAVVFYSRQCSRASVTRVWQLQVVGGWEIKKQTNKKPPVNIMIGPWWLVV